MTATPTSRLVDLSHIIRSGQVTYPGLPVPVIEPYLTRADSVAKYAAGTQFAMDTITMIGNTGTYLDSPFHRYEGGTDLAGLSLETLVDLPARVFHLAEAVSAGGAARGIPLSVFEGHDLRGTAVILDTGWSHLFETASYGSNAPYLSGAAADYLVDAGVAMVGIDSVNIDDTEPESGGARPAHSALLAAGIHVVEHLTNLAVLPAVGATITAVPPRIEGFGTFPVRVFARVPLA